MSIRDLLLNGVVFAPLWQASGGEGNGGGQSDDQTDDQNQDADDQTDEEGEQDEEGEGSGESGSEGAGARKPAAAAGEKIDWRQRRMNSLYGEKTAAERRAAEAERKAAELQAILDRQLNGGAASAPGAAAETETVPKAEVERRAKELADQQAAQRANEDAQARYDRECNELYSKGVDTFTKANWEKALGQIREFGGVQIPVMQQILLTDNPAQAMWELSNDYDTFERVMALPEAKRLAELIKLSSKKPPKFKDNVEDEDGSGKRPSNVPDPEEGVRGSNRGRRGAAGNVDLYDPNVPDDDWFAKREKERAARWAARQKGAAA